LITRNSLNRTKTKLGGGVRALALFTLLTFALGIGLLLWAGYADGDLKDWTDYVLYIILGFVFSVVAFEPLAWITSYLIAGPVLVYACVRALVRPRA
jgi:hypothetical protein